MYRPVIEGGCDSGEGDNGDGDSSEGDSSDGDIVMVIQVNLV